MAYCAREDLAPYVSEEILVQLTDDDNAGFVDEAIVTKAIADAEAEIDSYCCGLYAVPFDPVPAIIEKIAAEIALKNLFSRRQDVPENQAKQYDNNVRFLRDVAKGIISLGQQDTGETPAVKVSSTDPTFTKDTLAGY
jgi:phage gp36-like protein